MMELENEPEPPVTKLRALQIWQSLHALAREGKCSSCRPEQEPDDGQKCRFPRSGRAQQGDEFARLQGEVDTFEHFGEFITIAKRHADSACLK